MSDSTRPPQLHLSIPPTTTSFKRSFEQYGFDVDQSPVGNSDNVDGAESNSNGDHGGAQRNERNKRARSESVLSEGRRTSDTAGFLPHHGGQAGSSTALASGPSVQVAPGTIVEAMSPDLHSPTTYLHISQLPPRLPTPDMAEMEVDIDMLPPDDSVGPLNELHTAPLSPSSMQPVASSSALPIPLPLSLSLPNVDLGLGLEGDSERSSQTTEPASGSRDGHASLARTLERFAAFDSEIDALRRVSPPPAASPPQLPPLYLDLNPLRRNHHRRSSSSGSSTYSSQNSSPAVAEPPWTSHPPMFLDVPPALFDRPFRGLDVDSDSSAAPSSRNSMDVGSQSFTASTHPPMLPPIATTSATIWEDDSPQSPVSAAATIASSSAIATLSVHSEQPTLELNIPEFGAMGSPLEVDPVNWFLPEEEASDSAAQPGPPDLPSGPAVIQQEEATPRRSQMDELPLGSDASAGFAALARSYGFAGNDEVLGEASSSLSTEVNPPGPSMAGPGGTNQSVEDILGADYDSLIGPARYPSLEELPSPVSLAPSSSHTSNPVQNSRGLIARSTSLGRSGDDAGGEDDMVVYLRQIRQLTSSAEPSLTTPSSRPAEPSSQRSFRHPLLHHSHRRPHQPSSLRSSTSLVGENRSERGRMRDELDLGLSLLRSEPVAGPSSTVASATPAAPGPSRGPQVSSSTARRLSSLEEQANAHQRQALEQLNRASELLRSIDQPWTRSARAHVEAATNLLNANLNQQVEEELPTLRDVAAESDDFPGTDSDDDESDGMDVELPPVITRARERFSASRLNEYRDHLEALRVEDLPPRPTRSRHVHPLLGHRPRPFLPEPALPSPDFNMDFMRTDERDPQPRPRPRPSSWNPWARGNRPTANEASNSTPTSNPPTQNVNASTSSEDLDIPNQFPAAIRRAYRGHRRPPSEGSLSQAMLGYAVSGSSTDPLVPPAANALDMETELALHSVGIRVRFDSNGLPRAPSSSRPSTRMSTRNTGSSSALPSSSSTLRTGLPSLPPAPRPSLAPYPPTTGPTSASRSGQDARSQSPTRPVSEMFPPGPYQHTIRTLEPQRTLAASHRRPPPPPPPSSNPVQVSVFDLLDRMDTREPGTAHRNVGDHRRESMPSGYPFTRPLRDSSTLRPTPAVGGHRSLPSVFSGSLRSTQPRPVVPTASHTVHSRFGSRPGIGGQNQGPPPPPGFATSARPDGLNHHHTPGLPPRRDPLGPFGGDMLNPDPSAEARERGRRRFGLPDEDGHTPGERIHLITNTFRVQPPPPQSERTRLGDGFIEFRRRLHSRRFNMDDYVLDTEFDDSYENLLALTRDMRRGTPQDVIETMESGVYKDWAKSDSETRCPICLDDYSPDDPVMKLKHCPHWMHKECIQEWLKGATSCPVCRKSVLPPSTSPSRAPGPQYSMRQPFRPLQSRLAPLRDLPTPSAIPPLQLGHRSVPPNIPSDFIGLARRLSNPSNPSSAARPPPLRPRIRRPNPNATSDRPGPTNPRPPTPESQAPPDAGSSSDA